MGDEGSTVQNCRRCDPRICSFQAPSNSSGSDHCLRPFEDQIARRRNDHESCQKDPQPINALGVPVRQKRPLLQLCFRHERDQPLPVAKVWKVGLGSAVALKKKRNDVRVEDDRLHAAGSVLVWPRHSWSAARKSLMDSSCGQKSPSRSFGSRGKATPWPAINSSTVGCPARVYFSANDIADSSLAQTIICLTASSCSWRIRRSSTDRQSEAIMEQCLRSLTDQSPPNNMRYRIHRLCPRRRC
jgi:hypothetical protein